MIRILFFCLTLVLSISSLARERRDLARESEDPTAPLSAVTLKDDYTPKFWRLAGDRHTYGLTVVNPFQLWGRPNLLGVSLPYNSGTGIPSGAAPAQFLDLLIFDRGDLRYGVGLGVNLGPPHPQRDSFQYGPALGFVVKMNPCNLGLMNLNYFSADVSLSAMQLIAGCAVGDNWTISSGNFLVSYDWRSGKLVEVPLSVQLGKVVNFLGQPIKAFVNPRYNIQDTTGTDQWTISVGFTILADPLMSDQ